MNLHDFRSRSTAAELMDDLGVSGPVIGHTLRELNTINRWLGGNAISLSALNWLYRRNRQPFHDREIHIADLGCGGGDIMKEMVRWAKRNKLKVKITGIDANPNIVEYARTNLSEYPETTARVLDIWSSEFQEMKFDIIHCSLFLHHFDHEQLVRLFHQFKSQARLGMVINDLHRHFLAFYSIKLLTRVFSKSYMVRVDAPLSVARAFSKSDIQSLMTANDLTQYRLDWQWAFRWRLVIPTSDKD